VCLLITVCISSGDADTPDISVSQGARREAAVEFRMENLHGRMDIDVGAASVHLEKLNWCGACHDIGPLTPQPGAHRAKRYG
jgi:hypothetical protein